MILEIQHETCLEYTSPIREWLAEFRMEPVSDRRQRCHLFQMSVSQPVNVSNYIDGFGNRVHHFNLVAPKKNVKILSSSVVETEDLQIHPMWSQVPFPMDRSLLPLDALAYLDLRGPVTSTPLLTEMLNRVSPQSDERMGKWICRVADLIRDEFTYETNVTDASSTIEVVLKEKKESVRTSLICSSHWHVRWGYQRGMSVGTFIETTKNRRVTPGAKSGCQTWDGRD